MSLYNPQNKQFTYLNKHEESDISSVRYVYTDNENSTWIVSDGKLFLIRDEKIELVNILDNHIITKETVNAIIKHPYGNYWIGIGNKIVEAKRVSKKEFSIVKNWSKGNSPVIQFYVDDYKRIWAGTNYTGLLLIDKKKKQSVISFTKDTQPTFRSNTIHAICQDSDGNLWVAQVMEFTVAPITAFLRTMRKRFYFRDILKRMV